MKFWFLSVLTAFAFGAFLPGIPTSAQDGRSSTFLKNYRWGNADTTKVLPTLENSVVETDRECMQVCLANPSCQAWHFFFDKLCAQYSVASPGVPEPTSDLDTFKSSIGVVTDRNPPLPGGVLVHNTPEGDRYLSCDDKRRMGYVPSENEIDHCRLSRSSRSPDEPTPDTIVFIIKSEDRYPVGVSFYSGDRSRSWDGTNLRDHEYHTFRLNCRPGEKICYGAWRTNDVSSTWGVGYQAQKGCDNCCGYCGTGPHRHRLLAGPDSPPQAAHHGSSGGSTSKALDTLLGLGSLAIGIGGALQSAPTPAPQMTPAPRATPTYRYPQGIGPSRSGVSGSTR